MLLPVRFTTQQTVDMFLLGLHQCNNLLKFIGLLDFQFGMGLSNPLHGDRKPGFVGEPLPGVEVSLFF